MKTRKIKINKNILPLIILLTTVSLKWLIEGILDIAILEVVIFSIVIASALIKTKLKIYCQGCIWLLFIFNIVLSLAIHGSGVNMWGRGLVTSLIICFVLVIDSPISVYRQFVKYSIILGIITALFVFIHFIMGNAFNQIYFPLLTTTAEGMASLYYRYGYYFGMMYNPHEPAGLVIFASAAILLWSMIVRSKRILPYAASVLLLIAALLTGKKAVLICAVAAFTLTILVLYGSRKQIVRCMAFLILLIIFTVIFIIISINNPNSQIFFRFNSFFSSIFDGSSFDSGRFRLYKIAFDEWQENKLFGIGWRNFNSTLTTKYGMYTGHEVNCDYLQFLCETGIIGLLISLFPIIAMLRKTVFVCRYIIRNCNDHSELWVMLWAVFVQIFTLIYAFVEIPFFDIVYLSLYIISCVIINSIYIRRRQYIYEQKQQIN